MGYEISWHIENQILLARVEHDLSLEELGDLNREIIQNLDNATHSIDVIFHTLSLRHVPTNLRQIQQNISFLFHQNFGETVLVGATPLVKYLASTVCALARIKMQFMSSVTDAAKVLAASA